MSKKNNFSFIQYLHTMVEGVRDHILNVFTEDNISMRFDKVREMTDASAKDIIMKYIENKLSKMNHNELFKYLKDVFIDDDITVTLYVSGLPKSLKGEDFFTYKKGHTNPSKMTNDSYMEVITVINNDMIITKYIRKKDKVSKTIGYKVDIMSTASSDLIASLNVSEAKTKEIKNIISTYSKSPIIWDKEVWKK